MYYTDNPVRDWDRYAEAQERAYAERMTRMPYCAGCGKRIETEIFYEINDEYWCADCMDNHMHYMDDFLDD